MSTRGLESRAVIIMTAVQINPLIIDKVHKRPVILQNYLLSSKAFKLWPSKMIPKTANTIPPSKKIMPMRMESMVAHKLIPLKTKLTKKKKTVSPSRPCALFITKYMSIAATTIKIAKVH